jgi:transaldolase/glucose-6-phosphate isomerase
VLATDDSVTVYADDATRAALPGGSVAEAVKAHLLRAGAGDYIALLEYVEESDENDAIIQQIRTHLRDATRCATTTGYGPRFLHSTGQLHKGGPASGVFMQITARDARDVAIPGEPYTFGTLKQAQALGDFRSLSTRGRRAVRIELGADVTAGLKRLYDIVREAVPVSGATGAK